MFRWIFSQETEEIAELFVMLLVVFMSDLKNKGSDVLLDEIKSFEHIKEFRGKNHTGDEGCSFYFDGPLREFFFDIIDRRKIDGSFVLIITAEDDRYYGFRLYCDCLTGRVTVDARDSTFVSMDGKRATRKARKLCKAFAQRYGSAMSGTIVDWRRVLGGRM
jgi:hypothetical protein